MMKAVAVILLCASVCFAQGAPAKKPAQKGATTHPRITEKPQAPPNLPTIPVFDLSAMDKSVNACENFYQYACGGWIKNNPIPADQASWGRFNELQERNRDILHDILEKATKGGASRSAVAQKIGDFYGSCMDETKVNALGDKPIEPELKAIGAIADRKGLIKEIATLQRHGVGALFRFGPSPDMHNAGTEIAAAYQGGTSLPDRDYYLKDDAKSNETREKYVAHVQKMFELLGDSADKAQEEAKAVMDIETQLAKAQMDRISMRNPANRDHPMTREEFIQMAPNFEMQTFLETLAPPQFEKVNVVPPTFFKDVAPLLDSVSIDNWKSYLRWHVIREAAPWLSQPFVTESFNFWNSYLGGQKEQQVRWKRCVRATDAELGEALGQPYVEETFGKEGKQRTLAMVNDIEGAMRADLKALPWMTDETKKAAEVKLEGVTNKIGYPDKWRDYSSVKIVPGDLFGNIDRAERFEINRQMNKIGKAVDKTEWGMTPPTVNAYYNPSENNINFPAGILQPPFYSNKADDAENFGGIGAVIGHELTHGFDDQGAKFDAKGNLRDWWTKQDEAEFKQRTDCISNEYDQFVAVDDVHLKGRLTLGENTADNGGVRLALMALHEKMQHAGAMEKTVDGFTPEQRFFITYGQIWCQNMSPEQSRMRAMTDPHSPGQYRVNGVLSNMPEFQKAFGCKPGQPMVRENACRVW
ncbi:MAG: M13 family metallopeptidase [Terriglobales bacterium]